MQSVFSRRSGLEPPVSCGQSMCPQSALLSRVRVSKNAPKGRKQDSPGQDNASSASVGVALGTENRNRKALKGRDNIG